MTARSAAGLALGILGEEGRITKDWQDAVRRANGFIVHDSAIAQAVSSNPSTAADLCAAMTQRRDGYSLGGIAQALGLLKSAKSIPLLAHMINDEESPEEVKTFAIGALGLILEKDPGAWSRRMRTLMPIPISSPILTNILSHL